MGTEQQSKDDTVDSVDKRLEELLGCGRYQYFIIFAFMSIICFVGGPMCFLMVFAISDGRYRCALPPQVEKM